MATISTTDTLFATASAMGRQFFNFCGSGVGSLADLMQLVRTHPEARGMVTLTVRNTTQGWSRNQSVYLV